MAISYISGSTRYIFYAYNLSTAGTMSAFGSSVSYYSPTQNGIKAGIVGKNDNIWLIELTNNTGSAHRFEYNAKMCFEGDAKNWIGLTNIITTAELESGESTIIAVQENGTATSIALSYVSGSTRYIFYAYDLNVSGTMTSFGSTMPAHSYAKHNMTVGIIGKSNDKWLIKLTNNTGSARSFYYNAKMCFEGDAKNWTGLSDVKQTGTVASGETTQIEIQENGSATSIVISYTSGSTRYIFYAYDLNNIGTMTSFGSTKSYYNYTENGMQVSIVGKRGSTWLIELTNKTGSRRTFDYNRMMCFEDSAKYWNGLSHVSSVTLDNNATTSYPLEISENGTAGCIAISYSSGIRRDIFYAYDLNTVGTMTAKGSIFNPPTYKEHNIEVCIMSKVGGTWNLRVANTTGSARAFEYNRYMCFEGDAKNWKGLSDTVKTGTIANGSYANISISENGTAGCIAISYEIGDIRYIFYAYDLNVSGTMSSFASSVNKNDPPEECIAAGTLITLADGTRKAVEDLTGDEMLLVWNMETGTYDAAPILFIDSDPIGHYEVIELSFSDGTSVDVIYEHGFWDFDLNRYVYLDKDAGQYIGHRFNKQTDGGYTEVILTDVEVSVEVTTAYSPVTYGHLCYYVNGMLSMPGGITGLFNIFDVDGETMTLDEEAYAADVAEYGMYTYEEFNELYPIPESAFEALNGRYLKVAIGKGIITPERIGYLAERYSEFFQASDMQ